MNKRIKDITGQVFGSLTAIEYSHSTNGMAYWKYQCKCSNTPVIRANTVTYQNKQYHTDTELPSCGCIELARKTKHGYRKAKDTHPAYRAYRGIMSRCYDANNKEYQWYGAVGVTICDEWKGNPKAFVEWSIANGWKPGLVIDKDMICKEKGISPHIYSPDTCHWITTQSNTAFATNRNNYGSHKGIKLSNMQVAELLGKYFSGEETNMSELARTYGVASCTISVLVSKALEGAK